MTDADSRGQSIADALCTGLEQIQSDVRKRQNGGVTYSVFRFQDSSSEYRPIPLPPIEWLECNGEDLAQRKRRRTSSSIFVKWFTESLQHPDGVVGTEIELMKRLLARFTTESDPDRLLNSALFIATACRFSDNDVRNLFRRTFHENSFLLTGRSIVHTGKVIDICDVLKLERSLGRTILGGLRPIVVMDQSVAQGLRGIITEAELMPPPSCSPTAASTTTSLGEPDSDVLSGPPRSTPNDAVARKDGVAEPAEGNEATSQAMDPGNITATAQEPIHILQPVRSLKSSSVLTETQDNCSVDRVMDARTMVDGDTSVSAVNKNNIHAQSLPLLCHTLGEPTSIAENTPPVKRACSHTSRRDRGERGTASR